MSEIVSVCLSVSCVFILPALSCCLFFYLSLSTSLSFFFLCLSVCLSYFFVSFSCLSFLFHVCSVFTFCVCQSFFLFCFLRLFLSCLIFFSFRLSVSAGLHQPVCLPSCLSFSCHVIKICFNRSHLVVMGDSYTQIVFVYLLFVDCCSTDLFMSTPELCVCVCPVQVFGVGVPNPYRLRPFVGARVPVNSSFSPLINIFNPHSEPLQVVEMYSSGGDLHLELPTGQQGGAKKLWVRT